MRRALGLGFQSNHGLRQLQRNWGDVEHDDYNQRLLPKRHPAQLGTHRRLWQYELADANGDDHGHQSALTDVRWWSEPGAESTVRKQGLLPLLLQPGERC